MTEHVLDRTGKDFVRLLETQSPVQHQIIEGSVGDEPSNPDELREPRCRMRVCGTRLGRADACCQLSDQRRVDSTARDHFVQSAASDSKRRINGNL
ncbi:hypothetical protein ACFQ9V_08745 [Leifsonia sp. NPDC056665]|uniref:hypothetical protein n=1 Tax=Leifsonia sp. NPDC056665 TaxID=3345901 RepID=UPI003696CF53